ncbi:MAG: hypothetical protein JWM25_1757 [Thermoleophilia bacterium]|nr:hypothetical protein [Thermoleophilia bacterium]MCZ4497172.1 hypothetical protein [Thermoleophilia bacterium]
MKRSYVALVTAIACLFAAPVAAEAAAPTVPTNLTATVLPGDAREATIEVAWSASTDPDGDAITYEVQATRYDMVVAHASATTTLRLVLARGVDHRFTVRAIDATGARSDLTAAVIVTAPPIPVRLVFGVSPRGGFAQSCAGVARACAIGNPARASVRVKATSTAELTYARTSLTVLWREAGTSKFVKRPSFVANIPTGRASIPLSRIVNAPGTWCFRAHLAPNAGDLVGRSAFTPTCVSYFLTPIPG